MNHTLNILFLGGAKRVSMARMFKQAAARLGLTAHIFSYELDPCSPIACEATVLKGARWSDPDIIQKLHHDITRLNIDILIPFVDPSVEIAANYAAQYPGSVFVPAGSPDTARLMFDKVLSAQAFQEAGLPIPPTYTPGQPCLRLIAKPRHGSASKGIIEINSIDTLDSILLHAGQYLIQERIDNRREITVDCYRSVTTGQILTISPRIRLATVGGEVSDTITADLPDTVKITADLLTRLDLRGAVTVQFIEDLDCPGRLLVMEVNPRLGGGAVCSVIAGADLPALIIAEALALPLNKLTPTPGIRICRYQQEVAFHNNQPINS